MKSTLKNFILLPTLITSLGLIAAGRVTAQTFTNLHCFTTFALNPSGDYTNSDGATPQAGLILSGNTLYGTANQGGSSGNGTVFAVNINGTGFTNLHTFTANSGSHYYTNSDGGFPYAGLILSGNTLYGTAEASGSSGQGTIFKVNTDGSGFTTLHSFTARSFGGPNNDGANPEAGLILSDNMLYGTAGGGGSSGEGVVFAVNTNGMGFTNLYSFTGGNDGAGPRAGLTLSGNMLYGTASAGGSSGNGTVFAVNTNGTGFTNLHSFTALSYNTNCDGALPFAGLILSGNMLYGTASAGGSSANGTVFAVNTNGTGFTNLYSFTGGNDGGSPQAGLILSGNMLYGTATYSGSSGNGTVFAVNTNGAGFTTLYSFTGSNDGAWPVAGLILAGNTLYGTTEIGGSSGRGSVFSLSLGSVGSYSGPQLVIIPYAANLILMWPTNVAGFTLQSTTNLILPTVWLTVSPGPIVIGGQNTVFTPLAGKQQFFRLSQ